MSEGQLEQLQDNEGWWKSGDMAKLTQHSRLPQLEIIGRLDSAINSGGETIFPEKLESRLLEIAREIGLPIQHLLFIPIDNFEWGQRLVGLIRWQQVQIPNSYSENLQLLQNIVKEWRPAEQPIKWISCPELAPNTAGKWERSRWKAWLKTNV